MLQSMANQLPPRLEARRMLLNSTAEADISWLFCCLHELTEKILYSAFRCERDRSGRLYAALCHTTVG